MNPQEFFSSEDKKRIVDSIKAAERRTSGEIRVHLEAECKTDVLDRAAYIFKKLELHKTAQRNGVLFYLAVETRNFAILGDAGINSVVPDGFWDSIKETMIKEFVNGNFTEGLCIGIEMAGEKLREHFPFLKNDVNELPDEISFEKK